MAIPLQKSIELPLLKVIADSGGSLKMKEAIEKVEKYFEELTDEDKASRLESGGNRWVNRVQWVRQRLVERGELRSPEWGVWEITDKGRIRIKNEWPNWKPEYSRKDFTSTQPVLSEEPVGTPLEELEERYQTLLKSVSEEILKNLLELSPSLFESVIAQLLEKLGYGSEKDGTIKVLGRSGDGGVDGECSLDPLGLHKVIFQAKKWTNTVGAKEIRDFIGALDTRRVDRGIFITTSSFSNDAKETAKQSGKVKLIDGKELAYLMIRCGLGVKKSSLEVSKIDEDYFSGLT